MSTVVTAGYDGSEPSRKAVSWAADEAGLRGGTLRIVSCYSQPIVTDPWSGVIPFDVESTADAAGKDLDAIVVTLGERHPGLTVEPKLVPGTARDVLVEQAADSALLVVGTTGAGEARSLLLGSVAHAVARLVPCPVALVPAGDHPTVGRVVVGVDGSAAADAAVVWATDEADRRGAELVIVHAWEYPYTLRLNAAEGHDLTRIDAELVLEQAVAASRDRSGGQVRGELVEAGAAEALLDAGHEADLVVVGSRGRGGFRSLLFGSVARTVTQHATCPIVVVRDHASDEPTT